MGSKHSEDQASGILSLDLFLEYYNHHRYPCRLYGKTPIEIIQGQDVDKLLFLKIFKQTKVDRFETNKNFNECITRLGCNRT